MLQGKLPRTNCTRLPFDRKTVLDAIRKDKKREGDSIHFVLLRELGNAVVDEISIRELEAVINN